MYLVGNTSLNHVHVLYTDQAGFRVEIQGFIVKKRLLKSPDLKSCDFCAYHATEHVCGAFKELFIIGH